MTAKITVIGSINIDLVARSHHIPRTGETVLGGDFQTIPGGKGANQAVAAARMGGYVTMVGRVGSDAFSALLMENLATAGIDTTFVKKDEDAPSGVALIMVDELGQNSILVASGANSRLSPVDVDLAEKAVLSADVILLQLETPLGTALRAASLGKQNGVKVILNPAPAYPLPHEIYPLVDYLIPNETEAKMLTGQSLEEDSGVEAAANILLSMGANNVIITLGNRGSLLATRLGTFVVPPFAVHPIDTTAAGDAFVGCFAVALAEGKALGEAVRWGNAAGALATTRKGAQPSLPQREEVIRLLGQI
ncbi:MAG TPA: ribokinase [Anaerolineaceae bacterium]|jgi:ribokinase